MFYVSKSLVYVIFFIVAIVVIIVPLVMHCKGYILYEPVVEFFTFKVQQMLTLLSSFCFR